MFSSIVELYRVCGRPPLEEGAFAYDGPVSDAVRAATEACRIVSNRPGMGGFEEGPTYLEGRVEFIWRLNFNEMGRFYSSINDFVNNSTSLSSGIIPKNYYLIEEDFLSTNEEPTGKIARAVKIANLINGLSKLALGDSGQNATGPRRLVFMLPSQGEQPPRTFTLATKITQNCLEAPDLDTSLLDELVSTEANQTLHVHEHRQLFRVAVSSILSRKSENAPDSAFQHLIFSWNEVLRQYEFSADCYVQKFSFEKLMGELSRTELDYSGRVAAALGDSSGKLLALPLSVAALAGVVKAENLLEAELLVVGTLLASLLLSGTIKNQLLAYERIKAGFELAMKGIDQAEGSQPKPLSTAIDASRRGFSNQAKFLLRVAKVVRTLIWAPTIAGVIVVTLRFGEPLLDRIK